MTTQPNELKLADVRRRFDRAAAHFDDADFVQRASFDGLVERLQPVRIKPQRILDVGAATGRGSRQLAKLYRGSRVISLDVSARMLQLARKRKSFLSRQTELQADFMQLPLRTGSVDLVFANLVLPWVADLPTCLLEVGRVLRPGGVFAFTALGPDSLGDIRSAWAAIDDLGHVNHFPDMHDIGDALVRAGLADPVLDVDPLIVTYPNLAALYRDLTNTGARNSLSGRRKTLTGSSRFRAMEATLQRGFRDGQLPVKLELVYGHAWGSGPRPTPGEYRVDPGSIARRRSQ